tara:strand:+ start:1392 stop:1766 length:375 start_codon:yes stop_codon:yes gene_type:complete
MPIPDRNDFSLRSVAYELFNSSSFSGKNLADCFRAARGIGFDSRYKGNLDRLSNFQNFNKNPPSQYKRITLEAGSSSPQPYGYNDKSGRPISGMLYPGQFVSFCSKVEDVDAHSSISINIGGDC